jgi:subtilisin family serine protease
MASRKLKRASNPPVRMGKRANILPDLDPHLQERLLNPSPEAGDQVLDVIAKLHDPEGAVEGLTVVRRIGSIVTGQLLSRDIEKVRAHPNVASLKLAAAIRPALMQSVPDIEATAADLGASPLTGKGVVIGIIDQHFDFAHPAFRHSDGASRALFLWDQRDHPAPAPPAGFGYGREFSGARIDAALQSAAPYLDLDYQPREDAHGTHVAAIAAGNASPTSHAGVAPQASIIFVHLSGGDSDSLGTSRHLLEAVEYVFLRAEAMGLRAIVNISLSTFGGPHDGSTLVEQGFDELLKTPGRAIVIAAGNSREAESHASGTLAPGQVKSLRWRIKQTDSSPNELEIWSSGPKGLEVTLSGAARRRLGPVAPGSAVPIMRGGKQFGSIVSRLADPNNGANLINIVLSPGLPGKRWEVQLGSLEAAPVEWHAWIERDDDGQSSFHPADLTLSCSLGSIACGHSTLCVASHRNDGSGSPSGFSGEGPTRDGRHKPDLSAPGDPVTAAASGSTGEFAQRGTSMSAPHVAGVVALLFEASPRALTTAEIRTILVTSCRRSSGAPSWDPRTGFGFLSARNALAELARLFTAAPRAAAAGPTGSSQPTAGGNRP